jgi:hypothetical protein
VNSLRHHHPNFIRYADACSIVAEGVRRAYVELRNRTADPSGYSRMLLSVDGSEPSKLSLHEAIQLALRIATEDRDVNRANGFLTVQMGPNQVLAALSAEFHDGLTTQQIELCVSRIEAAIKNAHLEVTTLFIKPQTAETWRRRIAEVAALQVDAGKGTQ